MDCAAGVDAGAVEVEGQIEAKEEVGENPCVEAEFEGQFDLERALGSGEAFEVEVEAGESEQRRSAPQLPLCITASLTTEAKAEFSLEKSKIEITTIFANNVTWLGQTRSNPSHLLS